MNDFKLWIVYTPLFSAWAAKTKLYIETISDVSIELVLAEDERCSLYGINRFPCLVALKYDQPFRKLFGKYENGKYVEWIEGLNWLKDR